MNKIKITWKDFSKAEKDVKCGVSLEFDTELFVTPIQFCDMAYRATNTCSGALWELIEPMLPSDRKRTAISAGDEVTVDDTTYRCERYGWSLV